MKSLAPFLLLACSLSAYGAPSVFDSGAQTPFQLGHSGDLFRNKASEWLDDAKKAILQGKSNLERWAHQGREYIKQDGLLYEYVSHPTFPNYNLRVTEPKLCDTTVKQHSGYLDIAQDKHLFFWFFEARNAPEKAPLVLWLNGGPGCSSSTGLLFELGPCSIANGGKNVTRNPYSWTEHANVIFLDQPVNVGYSYAEDGTSVSDSHAAGEDVYAFLQIFLNRYPQYSKTPFHIAAESYGGTYAPNFANVIFQGNKDVKKLKHINLASVVLANGLTDPYIQYGAVADYVCDGPFPVYDDREGPQCQALRSKIPTCQRLIKACYNFNSRFTCVPAVAYCNSQLMGPLMQTGLNPYDVRRPCDRAEDKDGPLCYKQMQWIETWMNNPANKAALGVNPDKHFESCNMQVNQAFTLNGDGMHNSALLLPELVDSGVRLLVYAGNADMMCNYMGNERWLGELGSQFLGEFQKSKSQPWIVAKSGKVAGEFRSAGGHGRTAGNVTFVNIYKAGHMVPYDQPEAALDLFTRWITDSPFA